MAMMRAAPSHLSTDCETAADDLVRLVLALVETLRQLVERQAIRRVEAGNLADDEIERLGLALLRLEQRMDELKVHFGLHDEDLCLRLDLGDLADVPPADNTTLARRHDATMDAGEVPAVRESR
jgi:hypothetical protein